MKKSVFLMFHFLFWIFTSLMIILVFQIMEVGIAMLRVQVPVKLNTIALNFVPLIIILPIGAIIFYASYFSLNFFMKRTSRFLWLTLGYVLYTLALSLPGYFAAKASGAQLETLRSILAIVLILSPMLYFNVFGFLFKTFIEWINDRKIKAEMEKDNLSTQLELLKSKINPHFLFNTINNIDVLIQKNASKGSEYLNKLSDIMRFMLYETKEEKIALEKELSYIEKYIELQKIRTTNPSYVKFNVKGEVGNILVEPMLFIPFIENAFKHSENKKIENAIRVCFIIEKGEIRFECENEYSATTQLKIKHGGIGNELIRRRLELLYPDKHTFKAKSENGIYKVDLVLSL